MKALVNEEIVDSFIKNYNYIHTFLRRYQLIL